MPKWKAGARSSGKRGISRRCDRSCQEFFAEISADANNVYRAAPELLESLAETAASLESCLAHFGGLSISPTARSARKSSPLRRCSSPNSNPRPRRPDTPIADASMPIPPKLACFFCLSQSATRGIRMARSRSYCWTGQARVSNFLRVKKNPAFSDFLPPALPLRRGGAGCPPQDTKWNRRRFLPRKSGSVSIRGSAGWLDEKFSFGTEKSPAAVADPSSTKREMLVGEPAQRRPGCSRIPAPGFEQRCVGRYLDLASSNHRRGRYFEHKRSQAGGQSP